MRSIWTRADPVNQNVLNTPTPSLWAATTTCSVASNPGARAASLTASSTTLTRGCACLRTRTGGMIGLNMKMELFWEKELDSASVSSFARLPNTLARSFWILSLWQKALTICNRRRRCVWPALFFYGSNHSIVKILNKAVILGLIY